MRDNESLGEWDAAGWLEAYKHPTFPVHQWRDGRRRKAAEALATRCRRGFIAGRSPSTGRKRSSSTLREASTLALYELDHRNWQLAKQVESQK